MHRTQFSFLLLALITGTATARRAQEVTVMLSPAGDAHDRGRETPDGDERGIARQLCEAVKEALAEWAATNRIPVRVMLTHQLGETATQVHKANYANRMHTTLYISVCCHRGRELTLSLFCYGDTTPVTCKPMPAFYPYHRAHIPKGEHTKGLLADFHQALLQPETLKVTSVRDPIVIPMANLKGITAPAFAVDVGLHAQGDWRHFIAPLSSSIAILCKKESR